MKNLGQGIFMDKLSEKLCITVNCPENKVYVKKGEKTITHIYRQSLTIDDYSELRNQIIKQENIND